MNNYICDNCNEEFEFKKEISICPFCGFKMLRNKKSAMKRIIRGTVLIRTRADIIIKENKEIEIIELLGEQTVVEVEENEYSREITNKEYNDLIDI